MKKNEEKLKKYLLSKGKDAGKHRSQFVQDLKKKEEPKQKIKNHEFADCCRL